MRLRLPTLLPFLALMLLTVVSFAHASAPQHFNQAKKALREQVYHDRNTTGDSYCGCQWQWVGQSGGRVDHESCGYEVRAQAVRAARIEWEHVVPAWEFGHQRQCWQQGGRQHCKSNDPVFRVMEADMHNLTPIVGEVNADRSNYRFAMLPSAKPLHGACPFRVDFSGRKAQPPESFRGMAARIYFYMADRYDLKLSRQQEQLFMAWHRQYPASAWERERDERIATIMGHNNPFVIGEQEWQRGHKNSRAGLFTPISHAKPAATAQSPIHGNRNSKIYHLPEGCPSYNAVKEHNKVLFQDEEEAVAAGYRKARNCR